MYYYSIFQQLFKFIPRYRFEKSLKKLSGDRYCKRFSAWQQFLTCLYAQITGKDSLREIASGLATNQSRLYHLGMTAVAKSTLADAMNRRSPDIFKALFEELLDRSIACAPKHGFKFHNPLHAIDIFRKTCGTAPKRSGRAPHPVRTAQDGRRRLRR